MAAENLVNFHNSASDCLITLVLVSKSMFWGSRNPLEHTKIKYVVIQIPKFHISFKTWLLSGAIYQKEAYKKVCKALLSRICYAVDLAQLRDAEFRSAAWHPQFFFFLTKWLPSNRLKIGISLATCLIRIEMKLKRCRFVISSGASNSHLDIHVELFGCLATSQKLGLS